MGTNYYHRTNICDKCNRFEEKHIGLSSAGWQFFFQGYNDRDDVPGIYSFEDWKRELQKEDGKIVNGIGIEIIFEEFVKLVEDKQTGKYNNRPNTNYYDYRSKKDYNMDEDWKDKEGYSFTNSEFS